MNLTHGSLFSGIGGFDLAAEMMGWENIFHVEKEPFCQKILKYYWPDAKSYGDIKQTDFRGYRGKIDVLSGGFPCQPFSDAGNKKGTADDRYLWPDMLRAVREIRPRWIVGENVRGLVSWSGGLVFDQVHTDLETEGYEVTAFLLPACSVNAPHQRNRIWFIAYRGDTGPESLRGSIEQTNGSETAAHSERIGSSERITEIQPGQSARNRFDSAGLQWDVADATGSGMERDRTDRQPFARIQGGKEVSGRHRAGTDWTVWPTQSPLCSRNDGFSTRLDGITFPKHRNESIKGFGNAVVPELVIQIYKTIEDYEIHLHNRRP
jgi:DNA (cytosine-5)-methyltransferase 1